MDGTFQGTAGLQDSDNFQKAKEKKRKKVGGGGDQKKEKKE